MNVPAEPLGSWHDWGITLVFVALVQPWVLAFALLVVMKRRPAGPPPAGGVMQPPAHASVGRSALRVPHMMGGMLLPSPMSSAMPVPSPRLSARMAPQDLRQPLLPSPLLGPSAGPMNMNNSSPTLVDSSRAVLSVTMVATQKEYRMDIGHDAWHVLFENLSSREWNTDLDVFCKDQGLEWNVHGLLLKRELHRLSLRGSMLSTQDVQLFDVIIQTDFGDIVRKADSTFLSRLNALPTNRRAISIRIE
eukprot:gene1691-2544_t